MNFSFQDIEGIFDKARTVKDLYSAGKELCPTSGTSSSVILHDSMTKEEEEMFLKQQQSKLSKLPTGSPKEVLETIKTLGEAANDAIKFCQIQETKRTEIRAQRDIMIRQIDKTAELVKVYLDKTFDERRYQFDKYFSLVDKAIETGDKNLLNVTLQNIQSLSASSPFKDLKSLAEAINNKNTEWDI